MAKMHGAKLYLLHVEEGVTSRSMGHYRQPPKSRPASSTWSASPNPCAPMGIEVETAIVHSPRPGSQIVRYALEIQPDLIIMGAHGHRRLKDLIFGNTINPVRHELRVPSGCRGL
jgi:manganese transport protein